MGCRSDDRAGAITQAGGGLCCCLSDIEICCLGTLCPCVLVRQTSPPASRNSDCSRYCLLVSATALVRWLAFSWVALLLFAALFEAFIRGSFDPPGCGDGGSGQIRSDAPAACDIFGQHAPLSWAEARRACTVNGSVLGSLSSATLAQNRSAEIIAWVHVDSRTTTHCLLGPAESATFDERAERTTCCEVLYASPVASARVQPSNRDLLVPGGVQVRLEKADCAEEKPYICCAPPPWQPAPCPPPETAQQVLADGNSEVPPPANLLTTDPFRIGILCCFEC